ncbi:hypothetical protein EZV62_014100 [Acer yangbiense]|uniref:Cytochrome P450 n=1 Tax=Acer yangbiense TaxID=1000413 RepID=A0A5C7HR57_9ROSI|nr:hypothetical protein EZV62_014100 [Acer yangbiense]
MEFTSIFYSSSFSIFSLIITITILAFRFFVQYSKTEYKKNYQNLPPGPSPIPILGNLHLMKLPVHRTLYKLSQKYGPVFSLRFGSRFVTVVTSSSVVEKCFTKSDVVLANRPKFLAGKHVGYNYANIVNAPYGDHWRNLRRISALEIFSTTRINKFQSIRKDEVLQLLKKLSRDSLRGGPDAAAASAKVELRPLLTELTFNGVLRMVSGKRFHGGDDGGEASTFRELMAEVMDASQTSNPVDFLPILKWIKYSGYEKKLMRLGQRTDEFLQNLIEEHHRQKVEENDSQSRNTMIDHLLSLQESQPEYYTDQMIKGLVLVLFVAGTDTSAVTLEWAMAELLNRPDILKKARAELDGEIGNTRLIDESDLPKLRYLQSIVFETLRLYPVTPLLLPHTPSEDCMIGGYNVPRDTIVFVNAWAIHRDPTLWDDPTRFDPDRFVNGPEDLAQKILTFGLGRRACPGSGLAHRTLGLTLGSLIQCFDWERVCEKKIDMSEVGGLTMNLVQPLEALCKVRPTMIDLLSQK